MSLDFSTVSNVATSIPFVVIGLRGIFGARPRLVRSPSASHLIFGLSLILVGLGSCFYHWSPSPTRLLWDRLPIAICLAAVASAVTNGRVKGLGTILFWPGSGLAVLAVLYWYATSMTGQEDLRPWIVTQVLAVIWIAAAAFRGPAPIANTIRTALPFYAGGRVCEFFEQPMYHRLGFDVGHPLKHLLVALAAFLILESLRSVPSADFRSRTFVPSV